MGKSFCVIDFTKRLKKESELPFYRLTLLQNQIVISIIWDKSKSESNRELGELLHAYL